MTKRRLVEEFAIILGALSPANQEFMWQLRSEGITVESDGYFIPFSVCGVESRDAVHGWAFPLFDPVHDKVRVSIVLKACFSPDGKPLSRHRINSIMRHQSGEICNTVTKVYSQHRVKQALTRRKEVLAV